MKEKDPTIDRIREVRHQISAELGHDPGAAPRREVLLLRRDELEAVELRDELALAHALSGTREDALKAVQADMVAGGDTQPAGHVARSSGSGRMATAPFVVDDPPTGLRAVMLGEPVAIGLSASDSPDSRFSHTAELSGSATKLSGSRSTRRLAVSSSKQQS